jgi:phosphohistidine phosphatase SixA
MSASAESAQSGGFFLAASAKLFLRLGVVKQGLANVLFWSHHPTIGDIISNKYVKVLQHPQKQVILPTGTATVILSA